MRHGFLLIDKPLGCTSHDVVQRLRKQLHEKDIGHLGTLDPAASGLLVLAVGKKALKVIELFGDSTKEYDAEITFGFESTTYDREGVLEKVEPKPGWNEPTREQIQKVLDDKFAGTVSQTPPAFSAIHVQGVRAHELARRGKEVHLAPREVELACGVRSYEYPTLKLHLRCSSGTYVRSLAHELGQALRCGGYLSDLRRTHVRDWRLDDAKRLEDATWSDIIPLKEVLKPFPGIEVTDKEAEDIRFGRAIQHEVKPNVIAWNQDLPIALLTPLKDGSRACKPRKVF